jgi:hypothetical protein
MCSRVFIGIMGWRTMIPVIVTILCSCSSKEARRKVDTIFGLELGMKQNDVNRLLTDTFNRDSGSYYFNEHLVIHFRGTKDKKVEIIFYEPEFRDSVLVDYSYTLQVVSTDKSYIEEFHMKILDELQGQHGDAKSVNFNGDKESILDWDLGDKAMLRLKIDKEDNLYILNYRMVKV